MNSGNLLTIGSIFYSILLIMIFLTKKKIDEHINDETINNKSNIELYYVGDKSLPNLVINN